MSVQVVLSTGSIPLPLSTEGKIRKAKKKGYDGVELLLTRRALNNLEGEKKEKSIYSLHQPFREGGSDLLDKLAFFDLKPFPAPWSYSDYLQTSCETKAPIIFHVNDDHFYRLEPDIEYLKKANVVLEFNTYQVDYPEGFSVNSFLRMANRYDSKICFDVGYAAQVGWDIEEAFLKLKDRIEIIHFYDLKCKDPKKTFDKNLTPGSGILQLDRFLQAVNESNWSGQITLELLPEPFSNHEKAAKYVKKHLN